MVSATNAACNIYSSVTYLVTSWPPWTAVEEGDTATFGVVRTYRRYLRGTILIRTCDQPNKLCISPFLLTIFGPDYCTPVIVIQRRTSPPRTTTHNPSKRSVIDRRFSTKKPFSFPFFLMQLVPSTPRHACKKVSRKHSKVWLRRVNTKSCLSPKVDPILKLSIARYKTTA